MPRECGIVFLDINMEDMDGLEAAGKIKAECPKVHIVLVTACVNYAPDGYKVKASRFFLKDDLEQTLPECVVKQKESIMQTSKYMGAGYGYRLSEEAGKLQGQRDNGGAYSFSDRAADYVRAYGNLYDEIVQGYKDGTAERYVEENSETGFRKMTLDEELAGLDKAFRKMADGAGVKEMISGEFERLASKGGSRQTSFTDVNKKPQGTDVPQKLMALAQAWKDAYKVSGSKEGGMEKVLSMLDGMFGIKNEA